MKVRADIAAMLRDGHTDTYITAHAHVTHTTVAAARAALRIPKCRPGQRSPDSLEQVLQARTRPAGIHLEWTGQYLRKTPIARYRGRAVVRFGGVVPGATLPGRDQVIAAVHNQARLGDRRRLKRGNRRCAVESESNDVRADQIV